MNEQQFTSYPVDDELTLEQLQLTDAEEFFGVIDTNRDYLGKFLPWPHSTKTVDDSRDFITRTLKNRETGSEYDYGIKRDGSIIGHISLMHLSDDDEPEIGYWVASEYSGQNIATRATKALSVFAIETLGISSVILRADPTNIASNKVALKSGFRYAYSSYIDRRYLNVYKYPDTTPRTSDLHDAK